MPELTPTGAVDVVERQVRRVRRRKNLYELQRALYLAIVAAGGASIVLLPLALFARAELFGIVAWSTLVALAILTAALAYGGARRRLSRAQAVGWIESHGGCGGRVRTLLELGRAPTIATGFFHPLLVSEVAATLDAWSPHRLVPRRVPRGALASALGVLVVLAVVVRLASLATPAAPTIAFDDRRDGGGREEYPADAPDIGDRIITAPSASEPETERRPTDRAPAADSRLARLSSALQDDVREQVWGKAWERVRAALARAGANGPDDRDEDVAHGEDGTDDRELAKAHEPSARGPKPAGAHDDGDESDDDPSKQARRAQADADERDGGGTSGAGNGTSPADLFGGSSVDTARTNASFELSLAARMRSDQAGRRQPGGTAPDADTDARPTLAADQRRETAAHRMTVPAAYEQVVREVFAHREEP